MAYDITVVIADATRLASIKTGLPLAGRVIRFTDNNLVSALESIQMNHPKLIAVEAAFAQSAQGQMFIERIEKLKIRDSTIRLIVQSNGRWATTPYTAQPVTAGLDIATAAGDRKAPVVARPVAVAAPVKGTNTRRAHRFKVLNSLNAVVESAQANLVNISILGAQVVSQPVLRPNDSVKIVLPDANDMVRLTAHVAWSTFEQTPKGMETYYRAGMEFTDAAKEILEDYCRRHCAGDPLPSY